MFHTREVAGSKPAVPIDRNPRRLEIRRRCELRGGADKSGIGADRLDHQLGEFVPIEFKVPCEDRHAGVAAAADLLLKSLR
jgi:hypothetical protein